MKNKTLLAVVIGIVFQIVPQVTNAQFSLESLLPKREGQVEINILDPKHEQILSLSIKEFSACVEKTLKYFEMDKATDLCIDIVVNREDGSEEVMFRELPSIMMSQSREYYCIYVNPSVLMGEPAEYKYMAYYATCHIAVSKGKTYGLSSLPPNIKLDTEDVDERINKSIGNILEEGEYLKLMTNIRTIFGLSEEDSRKYVLRTLDYVLER